MSEHISERALTLEGQDAIRQEALSLIQSERMENSAVAKESGIAYSTLGAFLRTTYTGNNARVATDLERWIISRQNARRTRAVLPQVPPFVVTETSEAMMLALEHAQFLQDMVVVTGPPGVGKTWCCEQYMRTNPNVWMITAESAAHNSPRRLMLEIADTLGLDGKYTAQGMSKAIIARLVGTAGLLIVDEANKLNTETLDQLRVIPDKAKVAVALVGNETVYSKIEGGQRAAHFAQLFSRVSSRTRLKGAKPGDIDALLQAWRIDGAMERKLLHAIGRRPGALRNVTQVLRQAHLFAVPDNGVVTERHIRAAWAKQSDQDVSPAKDAA